MKKSKPPLLTLDCPACFETYYFRTAGPHKCEDCGGLLLVRIDGKEPFEPGSYVGADPSLFDLLGLEAAQVAHA